MQLRTAIAKQSDLFLRAGAPAYLAGCGAQRWGRQLLSIPLKCSKRSKIGLRPPSERNAVTGVWRASMDWASAR